MTLDTQMTLALLQELLLAPGDKPPANSGDTAPSIHTCSIN
jgi:hypothetical protein